jgi:hypothetical protein
MLSSGIFLKWIVIVSIYSDRRLTTNNNVRCIFWLSRLSTKNGTSNIPRVNRPCNIPRQFFCVKKKKWCSHSTISISESLELEKLEIVSLSIFLRNEYETYFFETYVHNIIYILYVNTYIHTLYIL